MKKIDFTLGFYCLDVISLRGKEDDIEKIEKLGSK